MQRELDLEIRKKAIFDEEDALNVEKCVANDLQKQFGQNKNTNF